MSKNEGFDQFLKRSFQKEVYKIKDDGFTEKVIFNLPVRKFISFNKNIVLFFLGVLSASIFILSNGYRYLVNSFFEVCYNGLLLMKPSLIAVLIIAVFVFAIIFTSRIGYDKSAI